MTKLEIYVACGSGHDECNLGCADGENLLSLIEAEVLERSEGDGVVF